MNAFSCETAVYKYYWFNGIEILQDRWQHGEKVGFSYPSGLENILFKCDTYVLLVTKGLISRTLSAFVC
jgi:hypothetical protein